MSIFVEVNTQNNTLHNHANEDVLENILKNRENLLVLSFDCGKYDVLIRQNRILHESLLLNNVSPIYEEYTGDHSWEYWKVHIKKTLFFLLQDFNNILHNFRHDVYQSENLSF